MAQQVVIGARQGNDPRIVDPHLTGERLDRLIHPVEIAAHRGIAHHRLHPEKARPPPSARDGFDPVERGGGIKHPVACGELHRLRAEIGFDHQFAAIVAARVFQKDRHRQVAAHPPVGARAHAQRVVDMVAERLPAFVVIEHRRIEPVRQRGGNELRIGLQRGEHDLPGAHGGLAVFRQLEVVLHQPRLHPRCHRAARPFARVDHAAHHRQPVGIEDSGYRNQHGDGTFCRR